MKDELMGEINEEFLGLKEKIYSLKTKKEYMKRQREWRRTKSKNTLVINTI